MRTATSTIKGWHPRRTVAEHAGPAPARPLGGARGTARHRVRPARGRHGPDGRAQLRPAPAGRDPRSRRRRRARRPGATRRTRSASVPVSTYRRLQDELADAIPGLAVAARTVGSPQIRNRGTIGGNLGAASPAGDCHPTLLSLGAEIELRSSATTRRVPAHAFFTGPKQSVLRADELITAVLVPTERGPQQFAKVGTRNAMVIAVCSFALAFDLGAPPRRHGNRLGRTDPAAGERGRGLPRQRARRGRGMAWRARALRHRDRALRRARRGCGGPDRRCPRHCRLPPPRARGARRAHAALVARLAGAGPCCLTP